LGRGRRVRGARGGGRGRGGVGRGGRGGRGGRRGGRGRRARRGARRRLARRRWFRRRLRRGLLRFLLLLFGALGFGLRGAVLPLPALLIEVFLALLLHLDGGVAKIRQPPQESVALRGGRVHRLLGSLCFQRRLRVGGLQVLSCRFLICDGFLRPLLRRVGRERGGVKLLF